MAAAASVAVRHALLDASHRGFHVKDAMRPSPSLVCDSDILRRGGAESRDSSGKADDAADILGVPSVPEDADPPKPTTHQQRARAWIEGPIFEAVTSTVICFNALVIGYASSYAMSQVQANPDNPQSSNEFISTCGYVFYIFYLCELLLKIAILQFEFWRTADRIWNYFDLLLVLVNTYDMIQEISGDGGGSGGNTMWLRVLRLLKMCKMLRVVRVMRAFRELRLMLYSIIASLRMLFWSVIMLGMIMYIFGLVFLQAATDFLAHDERAPDVATEAYEEVVAYWGGVLPAMTTLYEVITGGNDWAPPGKIVYDSGGIYYMIFLFYISFMTFAVLNVLTGVVVDAAMQVASKDSHDSMCNALGEELVHVREAREALRSLDSNAMGELEWETLSGYLHHADVLAYFETLDIDFAEVEGFFRLLQNRNKHSKVRIDDFLTGCLQMKSWGPAKSVQLVYIMHDLAALHRELAGIRHALGVSDSGGSTGCGGGLDVDALPQKDLASAASKAADVCASGGLAGSRGGREVDSVPQKDFAGGPEHEDSAKFPGKAVRQVLEDLRVPLASLILDEVMPKVAQEFIPRLAAGLAPELSRQISGQVTSSLDAAISPIRDLLPRLEEEIQSNAASGRGSLGILGGTYGSNPIASFSSVRDRGQASFISQRKARGQASEGSSSGSGYSRGKPLAGRAGTPASSVSPAANAHLASNSPRQCTGLNEWLARHNLPEYYEAMLELAHQQGAHTVEDLAEIEEVNIPAALQLKPIQRSRLSKALKDLQAGSRATAAPSEVFESWTPIQGSLPASSRSYGSSLRERSPEMMDARWHAAVQSVRDGNQGVSPEIR